MERLSRVGSFFHGVFSESKPLAEEAAELPTEVEIELRKIFDDYDTEGSGAIAMEDFPKISMELGEPITAEEVSFIRRSLDPENSGVVAYSDFIKWWRTVLS